MSDKRKTKQAPEVPGTSSSNAISPEQIDAPFSPRRAFVVQFRTGSGTLTGRVEHMASGEAALFTDLRELGEFFDRVLNVSPTGHKRRRW
jgi:hypothetical protein